jgi:hypothetical protein
MLINFLSVLMSSPACVNSSPLFLNPLIGYKFPSTNTHLHARLSETWGTAVPWNMGTSWYKH